MLDNIVNIIDYQKILPEHLEVILNQLKRKDTDIEIKLIDCFNYGVMVGKQIERNKK